MERNKAPYRGILVCYDGYRKIGWRTEDEFEKLLKQGIVNWFKKGKEEKIDVDKHIGSNILVGQEYKKVS